jgi:hypothetical protein
MTAEQQATFDRDGYLIIRGALRPDEAADARETIDRADASMAKRAGCRSGHASEVRLPHGVRLVAVRLVTAGRAA